MSVHSTSFQVHDHLSPHGYDVTGSPVDGWGACIHHRFERQAGRVPGRIAVESLSGCLTYGELNRSANRLANRLRASGVAPDAMVGICMRRSPAMVAAVLGILKAGAAYVPLDPGFPHERLAFMLENSGASILLADSTTRALFPGFAGTVVDPDETEALDTWSDQDPIGGASEGNLAYVIYTSGSTGQPKGVPIEHRSVVNLLQSMEREPGLSENDVLVAVTTLSFDIHVFDLFLPLSVGARVVLADQETAADCYRLLGLIEQSGANILQATPATWRLLLEGGWSIDQRLRKALSGGEPMTRRLADRLLQRCDEVWNLYGPTETTVYSTAQRVLPGEGPVAIGRPIAKTSVYLLDEQLQHVPEGEVGELVIGGAGLARGYWKSPALTAERFIPDRFGGRPESLVYRTGDLARWLPDGSLECLGRIDHQVKIRGYRVEPGEIEEALCRIPGVREAVVVALDDPSGEKRLVAYCLPSGPHVPSTHQLVAELRAHLPAYMVPATFVSLESLPLTPNGKVDRKALPAPPESRPDQDRPLVEPANETESRMRLLWEEVLRVHSIGVEDDFIALGGNSLSCVQLLTRINERFGTSLSPSVLLQGATVRGVARQVIEGPDSLPQCPLVLLRRGQGRPIVFLPGIGGIVDELRDLALQLDTGRPIYAMSAPGLDGVSEPIDRVEDLVAYYLRHLCSIQAEGPYTLLGNSFGGMIVFEMALQLRAAGQSIDYLGVLDEPAPGHTRHGTWSCAVLARVAYRFSHWTVRGFFRPGRSEHATSVIACISSLLEKGKGYAGWLRRRARARAEGRTVYSPEVTNAAELPFLIGGVIEAHLKATRRYDPAPVPTRLFLYRVPDEYPWLQAEREDLGWSKYAWEGVKVRFISGSHHDIYKSDSAHTLAMMIRSDMRVVGSQP